MQQILDFGFDILLGQIFGLISWKKFVSQLKVLGNFWDQHFYDSWIPLQVSGHDFGWKNLVARLDHVRKIKFIL